MSNKLWEKNFEVNKEIERFTVGRDREMDLYLAKYDVLGSMAHTCARGGAAYHACLCAPLGAQSHCRRRAPQRAPTYAPVQ